MKCFVLFMLSRMSGNLKGVCFFDLSGFAGNKLKAKSMGKSVFSSMLLQNPLYKECIRKVNVDKQLKCLMYRVHGRC